MVDDVALEWGRLWHEMAVANGDESLLGDVRRLAAALKIDEALRSLRAADVSAEDVLALPSDRRSAALAARSELALLRELVELLQAERASAEDRAVEVIQSVQAMHAGETARDVQETAAQATDTARELAQEQARLRKLHAELAALAPDAPGRSGAQAAVHGTEAYIRFLNASADFDTHQRRVSLHLRQPHAESAPA